MFVFTERTGRAEFWWFAGPWLAASIPLLLYAATLVQSSDGFKVWLAAFIALNLPVLSASVRRALDAGTYSSRTSFAGWGFVGLMVGPSAYILQKTFPEQHSAGFMLGLMLLAPPLGLASFIYANSAPSKPIDGNPKVPT
jgi:uncharacterized membrane protein YhaH (DUF805 family)